MAKIDYLDEALEAVGLIRKTETSAFGTFFAGIGLGLIGGGIAALLLTPWKGEETREKLVQYGEDFGKTITEGVTTIAKNIQGSAPAAVSSLASSNDYQGTRVGV